MILAKLSHNSRKEFLKTSTGQQEKVWCQSKQKMIVQYLW